MLHEKSLPRRLWTEALNCETYIQNISPHRYVKDKPPLSRDDFKDENLFLNVETLANLIDPSNANYKCLAIFL